MVQLFPELIDQTGSKIGLTRVIIIYIRITKGNQLGHWNLSKPITGLVTKCHPLMDRHLIHETKWMNGYCRLSSNPLGNMHRVQ